jgi:hypothetical protein
MAELRWARLRVEAPCSLRRGAWYRVVEVGNDEVLINVNGKPQAVSRDLVEVQDVLPKRWTVVRSSIPARGLSPVSRDGYVVCPRCRHRAPMPAKTTPSLRCPRCNEMSEIAWDEKYLGRVSNP